MSEQRVWFTEDTDAADIPASVVADLLETRAGSPVVSTRPALERT